MFRRRLRLLFTSAAQRHHKPFTKWLIRQMDRVVATSPQAASYLERPATVVMHGVNCETFHPAADKAPLRRKLGLPVDALLIGCFGRIRAQKGVDLLVDAALALLPTRPDVRVIFTGRVTDDQRSFYEEQVARLTATGLQDRVTFAGELPWERIVDLYRSLDLFVAPARWEGFGLTPLEAMASGVPTVASRVGAFEALIRPHLPAVRRLAQAFTRDASEADDLAQDALIRAFRSIGGFEGRSAFTTWLYVVIRSAFLDGKRSRKRRVASKRCVWI